MTLYVFAGKSNDFTLYEDEGTNYNYEKGLYSDIKFSYNEADKSLTIGNRKGSFEGMTKTRTFNIVFITPEHPSGVDQSGVSYKTVVYSGEKIVVRL